MNAASISSNALSAISQAGTSIWLDDFSRSKLTSSDSHALPSRIKNDGVVGVTTNPSIFEAAISGGAEYASDMRSMNSASAESVIEKLTTDDVRSACELFSAIHLRSAGTDGRVSIEVDPRSARNTSATIAEGEKLWNIIDRPNLMIKVPATLEGLPAITALTAAGISVNITLIFSISRYLAVLDAYMTGLEQRLSAGRSIGEISSVASFFLSRIDSAIDPLLKANGSAAALALLGKSAIANAQLAYEAFEHVLKSPRWIELAAHGAQRQRPLWASTGVKDPAYEKTQYVFPLIAPFTVNTMPQATLDAVLAAQEILPQGHQFPEISLSYPAAHAVLNSLAEVGIDMEKITDQLEVEGLTKFSDAWSELISTVEKALQR